MDNLTKKELVSAFVSGVVNEIKWCSAHAEESGKSHDWEVGFVEGLMQALTLLKGIETAE